MSLRITVEPLTPGVSLGACQAPAVIVTPIGAPGPPGAAADMSAIGEPETDFTLLYAIAKL